MNTPTETQMRICKTLVNERLRALAAEEWRHVLFMPMDTETEADALIEVLKTMPTDLISD